MKKHVIEDAKRCLQCKTPRCSMGCPVNTPIREAIQLLLGNEIEKAGKLLFENNPLSIICSHVCPQENQCEGHCVLGKKGAPVEISSIEQYISEFYLNLHSSKRSNGEAGKIAIIGAGPAGITLAFILASRNYDITIYEGSDRIGGVLRYGIPEFRLPKKHLDRLKDLLISMGVKVRPNTTIGYNITIDDLFRDGFHAIFLGTGVWRPQKLGVKGETLGHVHYAIDYLKNPESYLLGNRVAVIGAGNVAMDVARTAIRHGSRDVTIFCNRGPEGVTARELELDYAKIDGAALVYNKSLVEMQEGGILLADSIVADSADPSCAVTPDLNSTSLFEVDSVIIAIGQRPRALIVSSTKGIDIDDRGLVSVDATGATSREGVFASGDVVTGAKTVVEAVKVSRTVADAMDAYVKSIRNL